MTTFHVITLFPESLASYLEASIVKRAQNDGHIAIKYYNPRDYAVAGKKEEEMTYAERRVDDRPYGGGPGMVMEAMPVIRAIEEAVKASKTTISPKLRGLGNKIKIIFFSPSGKQFTNEIAENWKKKYTDIILVCGRYEGIDARVKKAFPMINISVGPFTLTGGELPAMIVIDAVTRRIDGVLGHRESIEEERVASPDVYTRPEVIEYNGKKLRVPKVLLNGHHAKIEIWKEKRIKGK